MMRIECSGGNALTSQWWWMAGKGSFASLRMTEVRNRRCERDSQKYKLAKSRHKGLIWRQSLCLKLK